MRFFGANDQSARRAVGIGLDLYPRGLVVGQRG